MTSESSSLEPVLPTIRILLVDDQVIIRQGLMSLLEAKPDLHVVGEAANGQQAIAHLQQVYQTPQQPDVVLMDIRMPVMDGVAATEQISKLFPSIHVLVLTTFDDDEYVSQAMRVGAEGYLLKDTPSDELAIAIRSVYRGYTHLGPGLFAKAIAPPSRSSATLSPEIAALSPREREVLQLIARGLNNREIAQTLYISERTVKNHISNILSRLGVRDRTQAALLVSSVLPLLDKNSTL
jgi:DNA-binding NarL/FixJ family response regulator